MKRQVKLDDQWTLFAHMLTLVEDGRLVFPRQVYRELAHGQHPDAPGAWIGKAKTLVRYADPSDETMAEILDVTYQLVEENSEPDNEPADPYIVAMAVELRRMEPPIDVVVATNDLVDRLPLKIALKTACDQLNIPCWTTEVFIEWVRQTMGPSDTAKGG